MINAEALLEEFLELVRLPSRSGQERAVADVLIAKLRAIGLHVYEDDAAQKLGGNTGNLIAKLSGDETLPAVLFSAHIDRVPNHGHITPVVDRAAGIVKSDGTSILGADDTAGIVAILGALRELAASKRPHGDVEVLFSVSEEVGLLGAQSLARDALRSRLGYLIDCSGPVGKIVTEAPSIFDIRVHVYGRSAHAGIEPEKGLNALKVAAHALVELPDGRLSPSVTANFGVIEGGRATNVVCDHVEILGEARGTDAKALAEYIATVRNVFANIAERFNTRIDVDIQQSCEMFSIDASAPVVVHALNGLAEAGVAGFTCSTGGGSDGNVLNQLGMDCVVLGVGYSRNHTKEETLQYGDMVRCAEALVGIVESVSTSASVS